MSNKQKMNNKIIKINKIKMKVINKYIHIMKKIQFKKNIYHNNFKMNHINNKLNNKIFMSQEFKIKIMYQ